MLTYALYILVAGLAIYAWKDWFKSLCGLLLMMAVMEHAYMPKNIAGIQGLNPWNVLFVSIFLAWLASRRREGLKWDMPGRVQLVMILYLGVIVLGFFRALYDMSYIENYPIARLISDELINTIKWVLPGLLLFDGCRSRKRLKLALVCLLGMYLVISLLVIRRMPFALVLGGATENLMHTRKKLTRTVGYSAPDLSAFLAGASWAMVAAAPLVRRKIHKVWFFCAAGTAAFAQALTGGRAGYVAWGATGLILCLVKWRKYLILAPIVPIVLYVIFPGAAQRMLTGFGHTNLAGESSVDSFELTSGRMQIWPHVIEKIEEAPIAGYGRLAMKRTGLTTFLGDKYGDSEAFPHPHNMYLEFLLDNGIVGFIPIIAFFIIIGVYSLRLFRDSDPLLAATGGTALALILAQLISGMGSQHFYPKESTMCMWAAIFLSVRVYLDRSKLRAESEKPLLKTLDLRFCPDSSARPLRV